MLVADAQAEMKRAYLCGGPGVFISGLVWLIAGIVWALVGVTKGFAVLFVGGIIIFPVSVLICRTVFRAPKASSANPLEKLGLESTFILFAGILIAYRLLRLQPDLSFPVMAVVIGARYFVFRTIYGSALFWLLGSFIAVIGCLAGIVSIPLHANLGLIVGVVELCFSAVLLREHRSESRRSLQ